MTVSTITKYIRTLAGKAKARRSLSQKQKRLQKYLEGNRVPWSVGYDDYKWNTITSALNDKSLLEVFRDRKPLPGNYGAGLDERVVEYPFVISRLKNEKTRLLDAGSTFNYVQVISLPLIQSKELTIFTYYPESWNFAEKRISYQYGDLKELPFRNDWFDEIACISTLEHIGMDNSIYGYSDAELLKSDSNSNGALEVISEMVRVLKPGGQLVVTFPFGKKLNYGFFQQIDPEMLSSIQRITGAQGVQENTFYKYTPAGWIISDEKSCADCESFNPHTGEGRGTDGAAHSRAICAFRFVKNNT
jgi:SAM-dependent methyltransferase